jgi:carbon storage regulator
MLYRTLRRHAACVLKKDLAADDAMDIVPQPKDGKTPERQSRTSLVHGSSNLREDVMLVLSRKVGESIVIDGDIVISVSSVQGGRVKLCIDAPRDKRISRGELDDSSMPAIRREARVVSQAVPQYAGM